MNEHLHKALNDIGKAYVTELTSQLIKAGKRSSGDLVSSISYTVVGSGDKLTVQILADDYLDVVDQGRKPGKQPPIAAIAKWVKRKGIRIGDSSVESTAFVIARSIGKKGIKKTNVVSKTEQRVLDNISDLVSDAVAEDIGAIIDELFKDIK